MSAPIPCRHDAATMTCQVCGTPFVPSGRRRHCSDACRAAAWRRRHHSTPASVTLPPGRSRRAITVYECPSCQARFVDEQRCADCGVFARRVGLGGCCPHCEEAVTLTELVGDGVIAEDPQRRRR